MRRDRSYRVRLTASARTASRWISIILWQARPSTSQERLSQYAMPARKNSLKDFTENIFLRKGAVADTTDATAATTDVIAIPEKDARRKAKAAPITREAAAIRNNCRS